MGTDVHKTDTLNLKRKNFKNNFRLKEHIATFAKSDHYFSSKHNFKVYIGDPKHNLELKGHPYRDSY